MTRESPTHSFRARSVLPVALALGTALGAGCDGMQAPLPRPLPVNIEILTTPAHGASVDPTDAQSVVMGFSRPMDPASMLYLRRVSFLLPLSLERIEGEWNSEHTRVEFRLDQFPVQPGSTYEALFAGLRTADGELYNQGPYEVLFRVRGTPDLLPMRPAARLESREFCRRVGKKTGACSEELVLRSTGVGLDSLAVETRCAGCTVAERRDLFRRFGTEIQWLGFDLYDRSGSTERSVRWRQPPGLVGLPPRSGVILEAPTQTSPDGTVLQNWTSRDAGTDTPTHLLVASVIPVQIAFSESRVLEIEYDLAIPGTASEHRSERWWLYPGVGLVRRESRLVREGQTATRLEIDSYEPPLSVFSTP